MTPLNIRGAGTAVTAHVCPKCGASINTQALVSDFMIPDGWLFWGVAGSRWKRCHDMHELHDGRLVRYQHFVVMVNGRRVDRLAWIVGDVAG